ncbi:MAG: hypothetical protein AAF717_05515 [Bacteroidota bacterium]
MLSISVATEHELTVNHYISAIPRLTELVKVTTDNAIAIGDKQLLINAHKIRCPFDWYDVEPPYLFPDTELTENNLLALVFYKLGNHQRAFQHLEEGTPLYRDMRIATHLQFGYEITTTMLQWLQQHHPHNLAIVRHYGNLPHSEGIFELAMVYQEALSAASDDEQLVFSAKHFITHLLDIGEAGHVIELARSLLEKSVSEAGKNALQTLLAKALTAQLSVPRDKKVLEEIQNLQQKCIAFYEHHKDTVNAGLVLIDAAEIAGFRADYGVAKGFITTAIQYFTAADIPEFLGEAILQKAKLLYSWSKNGQPQYYKPAINAFQDALKVFKRDAFPQKFADIQHDLALIYSEIPVAPDEKPIWTAFCASAFKEALAYYTKEAHPYQYGMCCHNYATALIGFPEAKLHNNLEKAAYFFEEALLVRTAEEYPIERALTLLNQLEMEWLLHNDDPEAERERLALMEEHIGEIKQLVKDKGLLLQLELHENRLEKLKEII